MPSYMIEHQIVVRNRADNADLLVVSSVRGDTLPYIAEPPRGDGASFNPLTGESFCASYTVHVVDAITSGTSRVVTSLLEDVNQKLQLGYHKAFVKSRRDGGAWTILCAGYVVGFRLVDGVTWEINVQDASRVQGGLELFTALSTTTVSDFLTAWPNRGCLLGGPIKGSWIPSWPVVDRGGWEMRVAKITTGTRDVYWLEPINFYGPPSWETNEEWQEMARIINNRVSELPRSTSFNFSAVSLSTIADVMSSNLAWPGLILLIDGVVFRPAPTTMSFVPIPSGFPPPFDQVSSPDKWSLLTNLFAFQRFLFAYKDNQSALSLGQKVRVRALTILPSDVSPIYFDSHPVDLWTQVKTIAGLAYDSSAATALKEKIGSGLRIAGRITRSWQMQQFLSAFVYKPFKIGERFDSATGNLVPFSQHIFLNTTPSVTITDAHVAQEA